MKIGCNERAEICREKLKKEETKQKQKYNEQITNNKDMNNQNNTAMKTTNTKNDTTMKNNNETTMKNNNSNNTTTMENNNSKNNTTMKNKNWKMAFYKPSNEATEFVRAALNRIGYSRERIDRVTMLCAMMQLARYTDKVKEIVKGENEINIEEMAGEMLDGAESGVLPVPVVYDISLDIAAKSGMLAMGSVVVESMDLLDV